MPPARLREKEWPRSSDCQIAATAVIKHGKYQKLPHWSPLSFKDDLFPAINLNSYGDFPHMFPLWFSHLFPGAFPASMALPRTTGLGPSCKWPWATPLATWLGNLWHDYIYIMMLWICMCFNVLWCYGFVCFFNGFYDNFMIISWWLYVFLWDMWQWFNYLSIKNGALSLRGVEYISAYCDDGYTIFWRMNIR